MDVSGDGDGDGDGNGDDNVKGDLLLSDDSIISLLLPHIDDNGNNRALDDTDWHRHHYRISLKRHRRRMISEKGEENDSDGSIWVDTAYLIPERNMLTLYRSSLDNRVKKDTMEDGEGNSAAPPTPSAPASAQHIRTVSYPKGGYTTNILPSFVSPSSISPITMNRIERLYRRYRTPTNPTIRW